MALPTGWTQDGSDPANVSTHQGSLDLGSGNVSGVEALDAVSVTFTGDLDLHGTLEMHGNPIDESGTLTGDGTSNIEAFYALYLTGGDVRTDGGAFRSGPINLDPNNRPELPVDPTPQDIADVLLALGLITQTP